MHNHKNKWLHNALLVGFYLLLAPPVLAAVKDSIRYPSGAQPAKSAQIQQPHCGGAGLEHVCVGICRAAHLFAGGQQRRGECQRFVYAVSELLRRRARLRGH